MSDKQLEHLLDRAETAERELEQVKRERDAALNKGNSQAVKLGHLRRNDTTWIESLQSELIESMRHCFQGKHLPHSTVKNAILRWAPSMDAVMERAKLAESALREMEEGLALEESLSRRPDTSA